MKIHFLKKIIIKNKKNNNKKKKGILLLYINRGVIPANYIFIYII